VEGQEAKGLFLLEVLVVQLERVEEMAVTVDGIQ
jgi:hypothetical protein